MDVKIDSMHFVFGFEPGSFAIPQTKFADFLSIFSDLIPDGSQYILPIGDEAPADAPIMSLAGKDDTKIIVAKDRLNVFLENQIDGGNLDDFIKLIKNVYQQLQKYEQEKEWIKIQRIGYISYNRLDGLALPEGQETYFLDYIDIEKWKGLISSKGVKLNIRIEQKKEINNVGTCNYILNMIDIKKSKKIDDTVSIESIPLYVFDLNTKPNKIDLNQAFLENFLNTYKNERLSTFKLFE